MVPFLTSPLLSQFPLIVHGFTTRQGGVSTGLFSSLNTGKRKGDSDENVMENRRRLAQTFDTAPENLITLNQIHSNKVVIVDENWTSTTLQEADALVTTTPNKLIGIMTADCVPVLLADPYHKVVAAAHAGWQGAATGILENTITTMVECGAKRESIYAAIGPCIWQASYEVDQQFYENLSSVAHLFVKGEKENHWLFDLPGFVTHLLSQEKIHNISPSPFNTYAHPEQFFSYRRKTHRNEPSFGNSLSVIRLQSS